jgi:hypothetical protein
VKKWRDGAVLAHGPASDGGVSAQQRNTLPKVEEQEQARSGRGGKGPEGS